jgi:hypothetical protein
MRGWVEFKLGRRELNYNYGRLTFILMINTVVVIKCKKKWNTPFIAAAIRLTFIEKLDVMGPYP